MSDPLLSAVCAGLDLAVLEEADGGLFAVVGTPPYWFWRLGLEAPAGAATVRPGDALDFLTNFLVDAGEFWRSGHPGQLRSGLFAEGPVAETAGYLEAIALTVQGQRILVIERSAQVSYERRRLIQRGREMSLAQTARERTARRLARSHEELERRVRERTVELERLNRQLERELRERQQAEEQLRHAQKMEAVGRLAGGVAHDFNNVLTVALGYSASVLSRLPADNPLRGEVEEIHKAAERAASITRQLLAFSRKQILAPRVLDMNVVLRDLERLLRRLIREDVELVTLPAASPVRVKADPGQIEQVIANLAVNARDAMPQGGRLTIDVAAVEGPPGTMAGGARLAAGRYVRLGVSDTGSGMEADTQARIFEPFYTTKDPGKGTGLGLSTLYGIVTQSGGAIGVDSAVGRGTTFAGWSGRPSSAAGMPCSTRGAARRPCGSWRGTRGRSISWSPTRSCPG